jgi:hypothetical protein
LLVGEVTFCLPLQAYAHGLYGPAIAISNAAIDSASSLGLRSSCRGTNHQWKEQVTIVIHVNFN